MTSFAQQNFNVQLNFFKNRALCSDTGTYRVKILPFCWFCGPPCVHFGSIFDLFLSPILSMYIVYFGQNENFLLDWDQCAVLKHGHQQTFSQLSCLLFCVCKAAWEFRRWKSNPFLFSGKLYYGIFTNAIFSLSRPHAKLFIAFLTHIY